MKLEDYQNEIFYIFKDQFRDRIKDEDAIKELIVECSNLVKEMKKQNEVDLHQRFVNYLQNISFSMNMLEYYRPDDIKKIKREFMFLALIQYAYYCENLVTLFEKFIAKNTIYNHVLLNDIKDELKKSDKKMLNYVELVDLASKRKKNENNILITDFISVFASKYKKYFNVIFKGRILQHLRNAIAHNKFNLDEEKQMIKGIYNPTSKKDESSSFLDFIDLHDTIVMIYFCIVKELTRN